MAGYYRGTWSGPRYPSHRRSQPPLRNSRPPPPMSSYPPLRSREPPMHISYAHPSRWVGRYETSESRYNSSSPRPSNVGRYSSNSYGYNESARKSRYEPAQHDYNNNYKYDHERGNPPVFEPASDGRKHQSAASLALIKYGSLEFFSSKLHYFDPLHKRLVHSDQMATWNAKGEYPADGFTLVPYQDHNDQGQSKYYMRPRDAKEPSVDPRPKSSHIQGGTTHRKLRSQLLPITRITYDKYSIGDPPPCEIVVYPASQITSIQGVSIKNYFKEFGEITHFESFNDPNNALPLNVFLIKYTAPTGNINDSARIAYLAAKKHENKPCSILGCKFNVALNKFNALERIKNKIVERNLKRLQMAQRAAQLPTAPSSSIGSNPKSSISANGKANTQTDNVTIDDTTYRRIYNPQDRRIPTDIQHIVRSRPCIFVSSVFNGIHGFRMENYRIKLRNYRYARFVDHHTGIYIVFNDLKEALRCFDTESGRMSLVSLKRRSPIIVRLQLIISEQDRSGRKQVGNSVPNDSRKGNEPVVYETKEQLVEAALRYIIQDLKKTLDTDIRRRIIGPTIFDTINPANFPELVARKEQREREAMETRKTAKLVGLDAGVDNVDGTSNEDSRDMNIFKLYGGYIRQRRLKRRNSRHYIDKFDEGSEEREGEEEEEDDNENYPSGLPSKRRRLIRGSKHLEDDGQSLNGSTPSSPAHGSDLLIAAASDSETVAVGQEGEEGEKYDTFSEKETVDDLMDGAYHEKEPKVESEQTTPESIYSEKDTHFNEIPKSKPEVTLGGAQRGMKSPLEELIS